MIERNEMVIYVATHSSIVVKETGVAFSKSQWGTESEEETSAKNAWMEFAENYGAKGRSMDDGGEWLNDGVLRVWETIHIILFNSQSWSFLQNLVVLSRATSEIF